MRATAMDKQLLFRVTVGDHDYVVYTNGDVEGFGENAVVFNHFPSLVREFVLLHRDRQEGSLPRLVAAHT
jgi:hypothetical protein